MQPVFLRIRRTPSGRGRTVVVPNYGPFAKISVGLGG
jgi:hypothetical protein